MKMGVVADDITGANDIGSMFANGGYRVHVYTWDSVTPSVLAHDYPDVCIIDTNSRLDEPDIAYRKVFDAANMLQAAGCQRFFNKTCSVFRGNIGVEFDAMLDALDEQFAVVVLGFPKNGRITLDGVHYVHGKRLEESPFRHDPIHPMTKSSLIEILQAQTKRAVDLIDYRVIARGSEALRRHLDLMRQECQYVILDVPDQQALHIIAQAVVDERVLCGSSALAEALPLVWGPSQASPAESDLPQLDGKGILCIAGSLTPQTVAQIEHLRSAGTLTIEMDTRQLFELHQRQAEIERVLSLLIQPMMRGTHALVHTPNHSELVAATRAAGLRAGSGANQVARLVTDTLAEIAAQALEQTGARRLVVAGGETSGAVCRRLGVTGLRISKEIQPGLPSCLTSTDPPLLLVLKSGSFGTTDFLEQALNHLMAQAYSAG